MWQILSGGKKVMDLFESKKAINHSLPYKIFVKNCAINVVFLKKLILNKKKQNKQRMVVLIFLWFFNVDYIYVYVIL